MKTAALAALALAAVISGCMNTPSPESAPPPPTSTPVVLPPVVGHWRTEYPTTTGAAVSGERLWIEADGTFTAGAFGPDDLTTLTEFSLAYLSAGTWTFRSPFLHLFDAQSGERDFTFNVDSDGCVTLSGRAIWLIRMDQSDGGI